MIKDAQSLERKTTDSGRHKVEAADDLLKGAIHDINNLLTLLASSTHLLASLKDDPRVREVIDNVNYASTGIESIMRLCASVYSPNHNPQLIDLRQEAQGFTSLLGRSLWRKGYDFKEQYQDVGKVCMDRGNLGNIILNLINNAEQAMPKPGVLRTGTICDKEYAIWWLQDSGTGMDEETLRKIGTEFTTKENGHGRGVISVLELARKDNGRIEYASAPNIGTTVALYLPRAG